MKDYTITLNNTAIVFSVDEDWLAKAKINPLEDINEQIYNLALADPERSGVVTDNDKMNQTIDDVKKLVVRAKEINSEKNSDIRILVEKPSVYAVKFAGQIYAGNLSLKEADLAITKIKAYLDHQNMIKVRIFEAEGKTSLQRAMDLEAWIANNAHKVISVADSGKSYTLIYIAKGSAKSCSNNDYNDDCEF